MLTVQLERFLDTLERDEMTLLAWGSVDAGFTESEVRDRADACAASIEPPSVSPSELIEGLLSEKQLFYFSSPRGTIFRTRMAETVRLVARLRQLFPRDLQQDTWRSAASLVADYRLSLRPRQYPRREFGWDVLRAELLDLHASPLELDTIEAIARAPGREGGLARFQMDATMEILRAAQRPRSSGVVISAGTGTGKTLAFYMPALAVVAGLVDARHWLKAIALYPRVELLKDQFSQAIVEARMVSDVLRKKHKRELLVGALYNATPADREAVERTWQRRGAAHVCPYLRCPVCGAEMVWHDTIRQQNLENLRCSRTSCSGSVSESEVVLTRARMRGNRPDVLLTTTEMLNRSMASNIDHRIIGLGTPPAERPRIALVDEVHTFSGSSGAQNAYVIRRWRHAVGRSVTMVALSATLRDARRFFAGVTGLGLNDILVEEPAASDLAEEGAEYTLAVRNDPTSGAAVLATTIQLGMVLRRMLDPRRSTEASAGRVFAFTDDLDVTNRLYWSLGDAEGWDAFGRPRPPSKERPARSLAALRRPDEVDHTERFALGQSWDACVEMGHPLNDTAQLRVERTSSQDVSYSQGADIVVATASLEVGLDDPTVAAVIQHKAPRDSAQFVQRRGRAGRQRGTRPWTAVVLSDVGRDRVAYEEYERLFDPTLQAHTLPLRNRYVMKMQAAFASLDWLSKQAPDIPSVRQTLSGPNEGATPWAQRNAEAQSTLAALIERTLQDPSSSASLANHLKYALGISDEDVDACLWHPPRPILTGLFPTLLRRLSTNWQSVTGDGWEPFERDHPAPEYLPANLFSDLLLPETAIEVPPTRRGDEALIEHMAVIQGIQDFTPGRASRRFAVEHGHQRHWSPISGAETNEVIDAGEYCVAEPMGRIRLDGADGPIDYQCLRPTIIRARALPREIRDTSNARPVWRSRFDPLHEGDRGGELAVPQTGQWDPLALRVHALLQELGSGLIVHRYSIGSDAILLPRSGPARRVDVRFATQDGEVAGPAAVGASFSADGVVVHFRFPSLEGVGERPWVPSLRVSLFERELQRDPVLTRIANEFQIRTMADLAILTLVSESAPTGRTLRDTVDLLTDDEWRVALVRGATLQPAPGDSDDSSEGSEPPTADHQEFSRRTAELVALLRDPEVRSRLRALAPTLWSNAGDPRCGDWYRRCFAGTLGAAFLEACYRLCPEAGPEDLLLDVDPPGGEEGIFRITEQSAGGAGILQAIVERYSEDPRRFLSLVESALGPSEQEVANAALDRLVALTQDPGQAQLRARLHAVRNSWGSGREVLTAATRELIRELEALDIPASHGVLSTLNARLLRPGSSEVVDRLMARMLQLWDQLETGLGVELTVRQFAIIADGDPEASTLLSNLPHDRPDDRTWRISAITGLLWARGHVVRARALNGSNRFETLPPSDWQLVAEVLAGAKVRIDLHAADLHDRIDEGLRVHGSVTIWGGKGDGPVLRQVLLQWLATPVDVGYLLAYPRIAGWRRTAGAVEVVLELREAGQ